MQENTATTTTTTTSTTTTNELRQRIAAKGLNLKEEKFKKLKVNISTWNVNTKQPPKLSLNKLLQLDHDHDQDLPHIYAIGLQEVNSKPLQYLFDFFFNDPWTNELTNELAKYGYVRLQSTRLVGIILNIFVKKTIIPFIRYSIVDWVRLGFLGLWGNKGANICSVNLGNYEICFINTHLSAHEVNDSKRSKEYKKIANKELDLVYKKEKVNEQNYIFFFGDLNYRLNKLDMDVIKEKIVNKDYDFLLKHDQLKRSIENGDCFNEFKEGDIKFAPTYKFDIHTDTYDTSKKKRKPAWCDRICYKLNETDSASKPLECEVDEYNSVESFRQSDHKPVYGSYYVKIFDWDSFGPLVKFKEIKSNVNQELQIIYSLNEDLITHQNDWIGLYRSNFSSTNDYLTYIWSPREVELEKVRPPNESTESSKKYISKIASIGNRYLNNGKYILAYHSYTFNQIVGLSEEFDITINWI